ncbi:MAG TPA: hypothetical protein PLL86_06665 [Leptospiraceae bacterium]|nr:hypothetical protein [Leptospiraceae bacterium]
MSYKADLRSIGTSIETWDTASLGVLTGNAEIFHLAHSWISILIAKGYRVHVIDCAIRFNVYRVIDEANFYGLDLHEFLMTGLVQRAFTPYQILDVIRRILSSTKDPNRVYVLLAPTKQFFDGDVKEEEGYFLLQKLITVLARIQSKGIPMLAVESQKYKHKTFQLLFPYLLDSANAIWKYNKLVFGKQTFRRFEINYKNTVVGPTQYRLEITGDENGKNGNALFESSRSY